MVREMPKQLGRGLMPSFAVVPPVVLNEIKAMTYLQHHNVCAHCLSALLLSRYGVLQILNLRGVFKHGPHIVLVLQLAKQSLHQLLSTTRGPLPEKQIAHILGQTLRGLAHAHSSGWCHRDVAPGNVLLLHDGSAMLSDWGQATQINAASQQASHSSASTAATSATASATEQFEASSPHSEAGAAGGGSTVFQRGGALDPVGLPHDAVGTRWYKPPEVLFGAHSGGAPGDVWAFGMVLAEALREGEPLCAGGNDIAQLGLIMKTFGQPDETQWPGVTQLPDYGKLNFDVTSGAVPLHRLLPGASPHALEAVRGCLQLTPAHRMAARTLLKLPFFAQTSQGQG